VKVERKTGKVLGPFDNEVRYVPPIKKTREQIAQENLLAIESSEDAESAAAERRLAPTGLSIEQEDIPAATEESGRTPISSQPDVDTIGRNPYEAVTGVELRLTQYVTKPQLLFAVPPACNVLWHSMIQRHSYSENYRDQPTRLVISEGNLFNTIAGDKQDRNLTEFINLIQSVGFPQEAQRGLDLRLGRNGNTPNPNVNPHNHLVFPEEFYKGPVYMNRSIPPWFMYLSISQDDPKVNERTSQLHEGIFISLIEWAERHKKGAEDAGRVPATRTTKDSRGRTINKATGGVPNAEELRAQKTVGELDLYIERLRKNKEGVKSSREKGAGVTGQAAIGMFGFLEEAKKLSDKLGVSDDAFFAKLYKRIRPTDSRGDTISSQAVYRLYAQYEYYRARYGKRNGAAITIFNPYVVPAYPMVIWDDEETQYHVFGYAVTVTHTLSAVSAQTTVNYSFGRTFEEFYTELVSARTASKEGQVKLKEADPKAVRKLAKEILDSEAAATRISTRDQVAQTLQNEDKSADETSLDKQANVPTAEELRAERLAREALAINIDAVPANPIQDIRIVFQRNADAERAYTQLFWRAGRIGKRNSEDDNEFPLLGLRKAIFDVWKMVEVVDPDKNQGNPQAIPQSGPHDFQSLEQGFVPAEKYKHFAEDPDEAMKFACRPICTLHEWVEMQREKAAALTDDTVITANDPREGKGAPYWAKILNLNPGPGPKPPETNAGNINYDQPDEPLRYDTRRDWQAILLRLRKKFYHEDEPKLA
jgi:hypothetical protein